MNAGVSFTVRQDYVIVPVGDRDLRMAVHVWEPREVHGTVFCVHGFTDTGAVFDPLARMLAMRGFRVVAPDLPGRGTSDFLGEPDGYTLRLYLRCLVALSGYRSARNHLIGTSWGGSVTLAFLQATRTPIDRLVLNDIIVRSGWALTNMRIALRIDAEAMFATRAAAETHLYHSRADQGPIPSDLWPAYAAGKIRQVEHTYSMAYDPSLTQAFAKEPPFDLRPLISGLPLPTLILYGRDSQFIDPDFLEGLRSNPTLTVVNYLEGGHPPSLMARDQIFLVLGFLLAP